MANTASRGAQTDIILRVVFAGVCRLNEWAIPPGAEKRMPLRYRVPLMQSAESSRRAREKRLCDVCDSLIESLYALYEKMRLTMRCSERRHRAPVAINGRFCLTYSFYGIFRVGILPRNRG
jgi:hypothetical protein